MSFALTEDQEELRRVVRRFLEDKSSPATVRELIESETPFEPKLWEQMAGELGLPSLHIPEALGGQGYGFVELAIVFEEMGRALACAPLFSSIGLAANAILAAGSDEQQSKLLPGLASGETLATLALPDGRPSLQTDGNTITGTAGFVVDGLTGDWIIVPAGGALWLVDTSAPGVTRQPMSTLDLTRPQALVTLAAVPAQRLGNGDPSATQRALDYALVCLTAEMCGGARACLDTAVQYARDRVQFGVPIGSFQAIKHQLAELYMKVEQATSIVYEAAQQAASSGKELSLVASIAKAYCSEMYTEVTTENIQVHGGIGFTWEHDAHLYFRRARASEVMLGDATHHRERIASLLID